MAQLIKRAERFIEAGCFSLPIPSISRLGWQVGRLKRPAESAGGDAKSAKLASPVCQRVIRQPADLHVVAEPVGYVEAVEAAVADVFYTERLQFRLRPLAVEIRNCVGDVVDGRLHLWPWRLAGRRRLIEIAAPEDEMRGRHVLGSDVVGLLALLAESRANR
jgi:hypothetical protein